MQILNMEIATTQGESKGRDFFLVKKEKSKTKQKSNNL